MEKLKALYYPDMAFPVDISKLVTEQRNSQYFMGLSDEASSASAKNTHSNYDTANPQSLTSAMMMPSSSTNDAASFKTKQIPLVNARVSGLESNFSSSSPNTDYQQHSHATSTSITSNNSSTKTQSPDPNSNSKLNDAQKLIQRKERNREIARKSRMKKKVYMSDLESKIKNFDNLLNSIMTDMRVVQKDNFKMREAIDRLFSTIGQLNNDNQELRARITVLKNALKGSRRESRRASFANRDM